MSLSWVVLAWHMMFVFVTFSLLAQNTHHPPVKRGEVSFSSVYRDSVFQSAAPRQGSSLGGSTEEEQLTTERAGRSQQGRRDINIYDPQTSHLRKPLPVSP